MTAPDSKKRKETTPPAGYVCNLCHTAGHWIQQCSQKPSNKKSKSNHVPVVGVDPSQEDIERAKELQKIKPPNCFCGGPSRLKKVKKSNVNPENSRANGNYFFFCAKKKLDEPCRFARPVEDEMKPKKERYCAFMLKKGTCKKGDKCMFSHDIPEELLQSTTQRRTSKQERKNAKKARDNKDGSDSDDSDSDNSSDDSDAEAAEKKTDDNDNNNNKEKLGSEIKNDKDDSDGSVSDSDDSSDKEPVKKELFKEKKTKDDDSSSSSDSDDNNDKEEPTKKEADAKNKEDSDDSSSDSDDDSEGFGDDVY
jgi:hypothetical protein